jgi:hypothetical protein
MSGLEEDEGSKDGMSKLIADMCKGEVLGENLFEFVKEYLDRKVSPMLAFRTVD